MSKLSKYVLLVLSLFTITTMVGCSTDNEVVDKPENSAVYDPDDLLSKETEDYVNNLNDKMLDTKEQLQIGVYFVKHLNGDLEETATAVARKWQIGTEQNNGILLLVATADEKSRIETSDKVAEKVTDADTADIRDFVLNETEDNDERVQLIVDNLQSKFYNGKLTAKFIDAQKKQKQKEKVHLIVLVIIVGFVVLVVITDMTFFNGVIITSILNSDSNSGSGSSWGGGGFSGGGSSGGW